MVGVRSAYKHSHREAMRWADMDAFGHINNVQFFRYLEAARIAYALSVYTSEIKAQGQNIILANLSCAFRKQLKWPGEVEILTRTVGFGRTSIHLDQVMYIAETEMVAAEAESVLVWFDFQSQLPAKVPKALRHHVAQFEADPNLACF